MHTTSYTLGALAVITLQACVSGCASPRVRTAELETDDLVRVTLDANARVVHPHTALKFYVDIRNESSSPLDMGDLEIELTVHSPEDPTTVALRKSWGYRWNESIVLQPGKTMTVPIVPERRSEALGDAQAAQLGIPTEKNGHVVTISELPLSQLTPGPYLVRATVTDRFTSQPYRLVVERSELTAPRHWPGTPAGRSR